MQTCNCGDVPAGPGFPNSANACCKMQITVLEVELDVRIKISLIVMSLYSLNPRDRQNGHNLQGITWTLVSGLTRHNLNTSVRPHKA